MQAKKRYCLLFACCAFLSFGYFGYYQWRSDKEDKRFRLNLSKYSNEFDQVTDEDVIMRQRQEASNDISQCRMETCFDFSQCDDFKVYVYPIESLQPSSTYLKLLNVIKNSNYYTNNPSQACVFVLSIDTLDRDSLSKDYVHNMQHRIQRLPLWNNGQNHVIFNLYSGTWPSYAEELGFTVGKALLAKASISVDNFRPGFDISIPLFHKSHAEKEGDSGFVSANNFPNKKKYLLAFKGKRYLYGIGSDTRNSLFHLHNGDDIILVTTCKHGESWREHKDSRCDADNTEFDKYEYNVLLRNSTFCLVPRGRRLGSFRFLEVLQAGCIPVLLTNKWELPFSEIIDWREAALWADERLLLQVPDIVRSINTSTILKLRQQTQILWNQYFSSIKNIVHTTLEIIFERVKRYHTRTHHIWNSYPGALAVNLSFSDNFLDYPFYFSKYGQEPSSKYTAVIYAHTGSSSSGSPLYRLIKNISKGTYAEKIIIIWASLNGPVPPESRFPSGTIEVQVIRIPSNAASFRHQVFEHVISDAVFSLDEDVTLTSDELDYAFIVWRTFPERIVGYPARSVYTADEKNWRYSSHWSSSYSMVLTGAALYHRYWQHAYLYILPQGLHNYVDKLGCDDILMNFLVSSVTKSPPIKLTQRKMYKDSPESRGMWTNATRFQQRSACINTISSAFGRMPLISSNLRLDPVLFKDKVSMQRKKYKKIEMVNS